MSDKKFILEKEVAIASEKQRVYTEHVEPFINAKRAELFELFCSENSLNDDALKGIRMQVSALDAIAGDFQHYINTGKMAEKTLEQIVKGK